MAMDASVKYFLKTAIETKVIKVLQVLGFCWIFLEVFGAFLSMIKCKQVVSKACKFSTAETCSTFSGGLSYANMNLTPSPVIV